MNTPTFSGDSGKSAVVVGAGGVIGSHLAPLLGRMPAISRVTLIDPDTYEPKNLVSQDITPSDVGRPKVLVQARRLRSCGRAIEVIPLVRAVADVPRGFLRADVILGCLDSRKARMEVAEAAWRLGAPFVDAGVEGSSLIAAVTTYAPGEERPCLECSFDDRHYASLEQKYVCQPATGETPASNAPASLGALAAALQAMACNALIEGDFDPAAFGRQFLVSPGQHRALVTACRRNPQCRLADHSVWNIEHLDCSPAELTLADALAVGGGESADDAGLGVGGAMFVRGLICTACGWRRSLLKLSVALTPRDRRCRKCGGAMAATGADTLESLQPRDLPPETLARPLARFGLRPKDIFTVFNSVAAQHFELGGEPL